ncbi:MAG: hypothetical protein M3Z00_11595, partial [Actinomycetota bacterium]|nr:hypothetical protein [Actinomycetota bacterium]
TTAGRTVTIGVAELAVWGVESALMMFALRRHQPDLLLVVLWCAVANPISLTVGLLVALGW